MRVLFASPHPHLPDSVSGREISIHALATRWRDRGAAVAVFAARPGAAGLVEDETLGYPVYRAAPPFAALRAALTAFKPDVAIYPFGRPSLPLVAAGLEAGAKAVLHITNIEAPDLTAHPATLPDVALVANSPFTARRLETLYGIRPPVMLPLIEPELYRVAPTGDAVVMINPSLSKGVEIFFRLAETHPDIPFLAVESWAIGDAWRTVLINRARACGNVALWPAGDDMRRVLSRARLLLMPSLHEETYGRAVAEAQVSGIPALVSDRGALPETLAGGGLAVPLDAGFAAWSAAFDRLWSDADCYRTASAAALAASTRPERQPERIAAEFLAYLAGL